MRRLLPRANRRAPAALLPARALPLVDSSPPTPPPLPSQHRGKYTLEDMATGPTKVEYLAPKGWAGTKTQPFGQSKTGHEFYICHEPAFNFQFYGDNAHNMARIGWSESQEYGCGHPGTSEGIGLGEQNGSGNSKHFYSWLGSGRLQHGSETRFYHEARLEAR